MKNPLRLFYFLCGPRKPDRLAEIYAAEVLSALALTATRSLEGIASEPDGTVLENSAVLYKSIQYRFRTIISIGTQGTSIVLQANPKLKKGYALAKRVYRELIHQLQGKGVTVSLQPTRR